MRPEAYESHMRDLNRLVFAAEAIETPDMPDKIPGFANFDNFEEQEDESEEDFTRAQAIELGKKWQFLAVELAEILDELGLDDFAEELSALREKAKQARLAMIALEEYDPTAAMVSA